MQYIFPFRNIGTIGLPYDVTEHVDGQFTLLRISLLLSLAFFLIITLVSFLFVKASLSPLGKIIRYIRSFQTDFSLPEFPLAGPKNDEFVIVAETLAEAFKKIQSQTEVLRQFSIDAAHEFKTPLMIIHSEIDCALKSGDYQTCFDNIRSQIYFLDTMIGTLLTIARIEKEDIKKEKINISELFEINISEIEKIFHEKGLHVIRNIDKNIVFNTNRSLFQMIVSNLIKNAFNYTNAGEIEITLTKKGFSVRDTGIGIVKENIDKIWDRLYRVDSSWSVQNGHGLGLYLVKTIVEKLGHTIRVESITGKGSTFSVKF
jgi:signal transduction histidine kinase